MIGAFDGFFICRACNLFLYRKYFSHLIRIIQCRARVGPTKFDFPPVRSADGHQDETYGKINCVVRSDGMVHWIPPAKYRVFCDVDVTNWPFGEHTCSLRLGSWTYDGNSVSMQINEKINVGLCHTSERLPRVFALVDKTLLTL